MTWGDRCYLSTGSAPQSWRGRRGGCLGRQPGSDAIPSPQAAAGARGGRAEHTWALLPAGGARWRCWGALGEWAGAAGGRAPLSRCVQAGGTAGVAVAAVIFAAGLLWCFWAELQGAVSRLRGGGGGEAQYAPVPTTAMTLAVSASAEGLAARRGLSALCTGGAGGRLGRGRRRCIGRALRAELLHKEAVCFASRDRATAKKAASPAESRREPG